MKKEHFQLFTEMCEEVGMPEEVTKSMEKYVRENADKNKDGKISRDEFQDFLRETPTIFTPKILSLLQELVKTPHPAVDFQETKMGVFSFDKFGNRVDDTFDSNKRGPDGGRNAYSGDSYGGDFGW